MFRYKITNNETGKSGSRPSELDNQEDVIFADVIAKGWLGLQAAKDAVLDDDGNELEPAVPANYTIIKEDITAELAAKDAAKQAKEGAIERLKVRPSNRPVTNKDFDDLLLALGLK